jgi:hypothetical protein
LSRLKTAKHEISGHGNAAAAALIVHAQEHGKSAKTLFDSATAYVDCGFEETDRQTGHFALSMDDKEASRFAMSVCSLAPAIVEDEAVATQALLSNDVSKLFTDELSTLDIDCYRNNPAPLEAIVLCGTAARIEFNRLSDPTKYLGAVDYAFRQHENLLPLSAFVSYDHIKNALALAQAQMRETRDANDPVLRAKREDDAARRRWEVKQRNYENASPKERKIRDRMAANERYRND